MKKFIRFSDKGQSLILITLMLFALLAILALIIDGGNAILKRRQAQSAADAGALAGARELCLGNPGDANSVAIEYTENQNAETQTNAVTNAIPTVLNATRMRVEAEIEYDTFFATILGVERPTVRAIAEAACFSPTYGEGVLPVGWSCRTPVLGFESDSDDCEQQRITEDELEDYLKTPDVVQEELYIVMDSLSLNDDVICIEDDDVKGNVYCDFDGDGETDWLTGANRSWIDLDGDDAKYDCPGSGIQDETRDWILNGYKCEINEHTWINDNPGNHAEDFDSVDCRIKPTTEQCTGDTTETSGKKGLDKPLVIIPVYDDFCIDGDTVVNGEDRVNCVPPSIDVEPRWHDGVDTIHIGTQAKYYHVVSFVAFHITCVRLGNNKPIGSCPGLLKAEEINPTTIDGKNINYTPVKSIEGYFLEGEFSGIDGRGDSTIDTGIVTIYLDR